MLENLVYPSEAMRNFNALLYLPHKEVLAPRVLLLAEKCLGWLAIESVLIMEDLEPATGFRAYLKSLGDNSEAIKNFLKELFLTLAKLHKANIYSRDTDKNLLIKNQNGKLDFFYFDFDQTFFWRRISFRRVAHTLKHFFDKPELNGKLTPQQLKEIIDLYLSELDKPHWKNKLLKSLLKFTQKG